MMQTRKGIVKLSRVVIVLVSCCLVSFIFSLFGGLFLPEPHQESNDRLRVPTDRFVDLGTFGKRPVIESDLRLERLNCDRFAGGPSEEFSTHEMVYWQKIQSDRQYHSPFYSEKDTPRYLTFEPDGGGFNNIRLSMETVLALVHATGRTLVLPPSQEVYLLYDSTDNQRRDFGFKDFFPMDEISTEQRGLEIITMDEFLKREGLGGKLLDESGKVSFPPGNRTDWDGLTDDIDAHLYPWLRSVAVMPKWDPSHCLATFPASTEPGSVASLETFWDQIVDEGGFPPKEKYIGNPVRVYASVKERLSEVQGGRQGLCVYNSTLQVEKLIHFHGKPKLGGRLLVSFYSFLFFEDWRQDLWTKRFIRDHVSYNDEIQCAAARIVEVVRKRAKERNPQNIFGEYDSFHIRRGEFQYKRTRVPSQEIYDISKEQIHDGSTVYIATDEHNKAFFDDMAKHFDIVFLDDFKHLLDGINTNLYGMIDQLVASKGRVFFGCYFSTFSSYINRLRGYHSDRLKLPGFQRGEIASYYYALPEHKMRMREYWPVSGQFYAREFPISWRNIDQGIDELAKGSQKAEVSQRNL